MSSNDPPVGHEQSPALLAAILESSTDAIVGETLDGIITSWNAAAERLFGYAAQEMIGRTVATLLPEHRLAEGVEILQRLRRGERVEQLQTVRVAKDGRRLD